MPRRSVRQRTQSKRVPGIDAETRRRHLVRRLDRLEENNYKEEALDARDEAYVDEDDQVVAQGGKRASSSGSKRKRGSNKRNRGKGGLRQVKTSGQKSLKLLIEEENLAMYPPHIPTALSIVAAPSRYPKENICSVSGLSARYRCPRCWMLYESVPTFVTHRDTRCLCWKVL